LCAIRSDDVDVIGVAGVIAFRHEAADESRLHAERNRIDGKRDVRLRERADVAAEGFAKAEPSLHISEQEHARAALHRRAPRRHVVADAGGLIHFRLRGGE
jgi:hypothetical protein